MPMSKCLVTVGRKNSLLTGRNFQQKQTKGGEAKDTLWKRAKD